MSTEYTSILDRFFADIIYRRFNYCHYVNFLQFFKEPNFLNYDSSSFTKESIFAIETVMAARLGSYSLPDGHCVVLNVEEDKHAIRQQEIVMLSQPLPSCPPLTAPRRYGCEIYVVNEDCLCPFLALFFPAFNVGTQLSQKGWHKSGRPRRLY